jgi:hypothetical protein
MAINKLSSVDIQATTGKKQVKYINKDYTEFKQSLVNFTKFYFPNDYQDFSDASPGSIFIDMASYVGDVLSYYTDHSFKENLLAYAEERENIVSIAQGFGYKPRATAPSFCKATVSMLAPADAEGNLDQTYLLRINAGSSFTSNIVGNVNFISDDIVDFVDPTNRTVRPFAIENTTGIPTSYVISKPVKLISATEKSFDYVVGDPEKYLSVILPDTNVVDIKSVVDEEGNTWNQVDTLSQDYIFEDTLINTTGTTSPLYKIKTRKANRRFVTRLDRQLRTELIFGSGTGDLDDVYENPDYKSVYDQQYLQNMTNVSLDTLNFTNSNSFGLAPGNTTLTVTYRIGGGTSTNVPANTVTRVNTLDILNETRVLNSSELTTFNAAVSSVSITNDEPASGGADSPSIEEIRNSAIGYINAQGRIVTTSDYEKRVLSIPAKYGAIAKAFVVSDDHINRIRDFTARQNESELSLDPEDDVLYVQDNPINTNINLYLLGYDSDRRMAVLNNTVKSNVKKFLNGYRMLTDRINILDAFVVNFGINYSIVVYEGFNSYDVIAKASDRLKSYFDSDNQQINQPIIKADVLLEIARVEGVQSVTSLDLINLYRAKDGSDYSIYVYDMEQNKRNEVIYPSADPCLFELRYPQDDIIGTAIQ